MCTGALVRLYEQMFPKECSKMGGWVGRYLCCHHVTPRLLNRASPVFSSPWNSTWTRQSLDMSGPIGEEGEEVEGYEDVGERRRRRRGGG